MSSADTTVNSGNTLPSPERMPASITGRRPLLAARAWRVAYWLSLLPSLPSDVTEMRA